MNLVFRKLAGIVGALGLAILAQPNCAAQCGFGTVRKLHVGWSIQQNDDASSQGKWQPTIVGFWHVVFTAKTMNGASIPDTVIDNSLVVWHSDGTEIMNSGRPPQDGNFCLGVWKQTGRDTYKLSHIPLGNDIDPSTGVVNGPTRILEHVTIGPDGDHYSGTFSLTGHTKSGQVTTTFTGVLAGTRITVDTDVSDIL